MRYVFYAHIVRRYVFLQCHGIYGFHMSIVAKVGGQCDFGPSLWYRISPLGINYL